MRTLAEFAEDVRRDVQRSGWVEVSFAVLHSEIERLISDGYRNCHDVGIQEFLSMVGYDAQFDLENKRIRFTRSADRSIRTLLDLCGSAR
jgi:hypothetical protein